MREIPELHVLCLRVVGSHSCSTEVTFAQRQDAGDPTLASRLLRSFHARGTVSNTSNDSEAGAEDDANPSMNRIPMSARPCIGPGSARRLNANEVDLNHPIIGCRQQITLAASTSASTDDPNDQDNPLRFQPLVMQYGNPALDVLQSYIDSLVELGRMDDGRLGPHFFNEWKINVEMAAKGATGMTSLPTAAIVSKAAAKAASATPSKKRRRNGGRSASASPATLLPPDEDAKASATIPLGSISFHNCSLADETVAAMLKSGMCRHIAVLDLTGIRGMTDTLATQIIAASPNIQRLSLKNCRKLTDKTARQLVSLPQLQCLDVGGCFNMTPADILDIVPSLPLLDELHASGLLWSDDTLQTLVQVRDSWKGLSVGFSTDITQPVLRECLVQLGDSLKSLALPFCETVVDNALLGLLGRNMPVLQYLDLRGNPSLNTITGFYDGRASAYWPAQALTVLARYTGLSENSLEETRRVHPLQTAGNLLTVYLDEKGMGAGILRAT